MKAALTLLLGILAGYGFWTHNQFVTFENTVTEQSEKIHLLEQKMVKLEAQNMLAMKLNALNQTTINKLLNKQQVTVTAYSPNHRETDTTPFITASNKKVRHGIIAVSRDLFDQGWVFGRKVYIKTLGIFTIDDLMAARKKNHIDIFMFDEKQALSFGRRKLDAHLLAMQSSTSSPELLATSY